MKKNAFSLLHPCIQEKLYQMHWTELRPIQVDSIHAILLRSKNLILSANTASGKTEAAFLPIISTILSQKNLGVNAIYVGPLKALINDQFIRLEQLCEISNIEVFKWHGDVTSGKKRKFLKNPNGILLITPESIESLFINHSNSLSLLFSNLSFIVIDEMHSFIGNERGAHILSLLSRVSSYNSQKVRIIGLSATLGNINLVKKWLMPKNPDAIEIIEDPNKERSIRFLIKGYLFEKDISQDEIETSSNQFQNYINDIIRYFYRHSSLIFINSKVELEILIDSVKRTLEKEGLPDLFVIHHGSLSKNEREDVESALKNNPLLSCFSSSTLEMGIDIGNICRIGEIGTPWSVNSLVQRLGRSGRHEGESSEMIIFISEKISDNFVKKLFPKLLQAIAISELMLEKWYEPAISHYKYYSTLIQQILSVIKEKGGTDPLILFEKLIKNGFFISITEKEFISILKQMKDYNLIEQDPTKMLILGLEGERIVNNQEFYSVFQTSSEITVISNGTKIGTISNIPVIEGREYLILAGRRWEIIYVDLKRREIVVKPSSGGKPPNFIGSSGPDIHDKIREKMKEILLNDKDIIYLDKEAKNMLQMARKNAKIANLQKNSFFIDGSDIYWFTWAGTAKNRTICAIGKKYGGFSIEDHGIALKISNSNISEITKFYLNIKDNLPSTLELAEKIDNLEFEKYDKYLPNNLLIKAYANKFLSSELGYCIDKLLIDHF